MSRPIEKNGFLLKYAWYRNSVSFGETSKKVGLLQAMLNWHGIPVKIDRIFGNETRWGIQEYVRGLGLNTYFRESTKYRTIDRDIWKLFNRKPLDLSKWADSVFSCNCGGKYCTEAFKAIRPSKARAMLCARTDELAKELYGENVEVRLTDDIDPDNPTDKNGGDRDPDWDKMNGGAGGQHPKKTAADLALFKNGVYWKIDHRPFEKEVAKRINYYGGCSLNYTGNIHIDSRGYYSRW